MKEYITKEDFKNYFSVCQKVAWVLHSKENSLSTYNQVLNKEIFCNIEIDEEIKNFFNSDSSEEETSLFNDSSISIEKFANTIEKGFTDEGFYGNLLDECWAVEGKRVGELAREYYKYRAEQEGAKYFDLSDIKDFEKAVVKTKELIEEEKINYLFEPAFDYNGEINLKTRCDILINHGDNEFEIIEVKASKDPNLKTKPETLSKKYFLDILYQQKTLEKVGLKVKNCNFLFLRNSFGTYEKIEKEFWDKPIENDEWKKELENLKIEKSNLDPIDLKPEELEQFFSLYNKIKVSREYFDILDLLNKISIKEFDALIEEIIVSFENKNLLKETCFKLGNYKDLFNKYKKVSCNHVLPWYDSEQFNIFDFNYHEKSENCDILHKLKKVHLKDIDDYSEIEKSVDFKENNHISAREQFNKIKSYMRDPNFNNWIVYKDRFDEFFKKYNKTPIYMYDFETANWAIPRYENSNPYVQVPFQYSIHILEEGWQNCDLNKIEHYEFLAKTKQDPRLEMLTNLLTDLFKKGPGVYVAYYSTFEKSRLKELADVYPQYKHLIKYVYDNTVDLFDFFALRWKDKFCVYHPNQRRSSSIKYVQPAFYPQLTYKDLPIHNGQMALQVYKQYVDGDIEEKKYQEEIYDELLRYCERDTLAMVVVLKAIYELSLRRDCE